MAAFKIHRFVSIILMLLLLTPTVLLLQIENYYPSIVSGSTKSFIGSSNGARAVNWQLVEQFDSTVVVPAGDDYYVQLDTDSEKLREEVFPMSAAGLNNASLGALGLVPDWLQDPLALKFRETASTPIETSSGRAAPCLTDIDNDGDLDLILGQAQSDILMYRNEGTKNHPIFVTDSALFKIVNDLAGPIGGFIETSPTAADVDGDYDIDVLVGTVNGIVALLENSGTPTEPKFEDLVRIDGITISGNAAPHLIDLDSDGDLDVVVGDSAGKLHLFTNSGSSSDPQWSRALLNPLSEIQVAGEAAPFFADLDNDGDKDISIGDTTNVISYYRCVTSGITKSYVLDESMYLGVIVGESNHPALVDLDGDSLLELYSGCQANSNDGLIYYYDNYGNVFNPQWNIWSSYKAVPGLSYYSPYEFLNYLDFRITDRFANIIDKAYDTNPLWVDEAGFAIAHTPAGILRSMQDDQVQLFYDNVKYIYEIDPLLAYADVKEHNKGTGDYYSTVEYRTQTDSGIITREYPRDIYYWYIVHPKITEEFPGYVNPENGQLTSPSSGGRFWREYLFYHNDQSYPPDTSGSPSDGIDDYPTTVGPPLLKDLLSGVTHLWNDTKFRAPGGRDVMYGSNAVIRVSNWVGKTLILNQQEVSDDERPTQPVRIAHHHNGNCGELQDLTTAASRTALIPAAGVNLVAEDHVWIEFYENGWKQWDNHWSDAGSYINRYDLYWYGWNERGGSGIWHHRGDDDTIDVTQKYIPESAQSKVLINVQDRRGYPVDGARIIVGSHWIAEGNVDQMDVTFPFPGIWNYTDVNGESEFHLAKQNFTIKIISKLGNAVQEKTYIGSGGVYYFNFTLEGLMPRTVLNTRPMSYPSPPDPEFKVEMEFTVTDGIQEPPNPESGNYHPELQVRSNLVNFFITDDNGFNNYRQGLEFEVTNIQQDISGYTTPGLFYMSGSSWYFVLSNLDVIETAKTVSLTLKLYKPLVDLPFVSINSPINNTAVFIGDGVLIEGSVQDEDGIDSVIITIQDLGTNKFVVDTQAKYNDDNYWSFDWDTQKVGQGPYRVVVTATDTKDFSNTASILLSLILAGAPEVLILNPVPNARFDVGDTIEINGTVTDNGYLTSITVSFGTGTPVDITNSYDEGFYKYLWVTTHQDPGFVEISVSAEDDDGNTASMIRMIELIQPPPPPDVKAPELSILSPEDGSQFTQGTMVLVQGYAYDENEIINLFLTFGDMEAIRKPTMTDETGWSYDWDTASEPSGEMMLAVHAEDTAGNQGIFEVLVTILEPLPPSDDVPPEVVITSPEDYDEISAGTQLHVQGTVIDNTGIVNIELSYDDGDSWADITASLLDISWSYTISTGNPLLEPDLYTLTVRAYDSAGNEGEVEISVSIVDTSPPELEILTPVDNTKYEIGATIDIAGFASDNFRVDRLQVRYNDERRWKDVTTGYEQDTGSWSIDVEAFDLEVGENSIWFKVTDIYGNEKEDDLRVIIESAPVEKDEGNVLQNILEFLFFNILGLMVCGIFIVIFAVVIFTATRSRRRTE